MSQYRNVLTKFKVLRSERVPECPVMFPGNTTMLVCFCLSAEAIVWRQQSWIIVTKTAWCVHRKNLLSVICSSSLLGLVQAQLQWCNHEKQRLATWGYPSQLSAALLEIVTKTNQGLLGLDVVVTICHWGKPRQELKQGKNLEARTESEVEECSLGLVFIGFGVYFVLFWYSPGPSAQW